MRYRILLSFAFILLLFSCSPKKDNALHVSSPKGNIHFELQLSDAGTLSYSVRMTDSTDNYNVIDSSALGLVLNDQDFSKSLTLKKADEVTPNVQDYEMHIGKRKHNVVNANERVFEFQNQQGGSFKLLVRVFNDGFAFRYHVDRADSVPYVVEKEITAFQIPTSGKAWIEPYDSLQKWGPGHEVGYENEIAIGTTSYKSTGWAFPALFHYDRVWCLLTEADVDTTYCSSHLSAHCNNGLYKLEFPWDHEIYGIAEPTPVGKGSFQSPWRVGIVSTEIAPVVESNMVYHLARPNVLDTDMSWVKPGRSTWSWWGDVFSPTNIPEQKRYIDFASEMGWEYSLIDCNWHYVPEKELRELVAYATKKNVGILLWYNSAGPYTKVYEVGPLNRVHTHALRMKEFAWLKEIGVKGIKVDFFQSDKQEIMKYYENIAKDAAQFHLLFNAHSATIPRGWARTYPNFISMEAVKGAEQYPQENFTKKAAMWNTVLPFTRNVIGPMDYTPVTFSDRGNASSEEPATANKDKSSMARLTTNAHELALSVVFECGIQHFADRASSILAQPKEVVQFLKDIPVTWDDTHLRAGYPGKNVLLEREKNGVYYLGGLNGQTVADSLVVDLNFLPAGDYVLQLIADGAKPREYKITESMVTTKSKIDVALLPYGGFAAKITRK